MTLEIAFELNDTDLERLQALFRKARTKAGKIEPQALTQAARALPGLGLLDDAIAAELVLRAMRHEGVTTKADWESRGGERCAPVTS